MQIQRSTDNHLAGCDYLALRLEAEVRTALSCCAHAITRVEVHRNHLHSGKDCGQQ